MKNPIDEYMAVRKTAATWGANNARQMYSSVKGVGSTPFGQSLGQGAGQAAAGAVITGVGLAGMKVYQAIRKRKDFQGMMQANPDLQEHQQQNPEQFNQLYTSLRTINPGYAQDPIISGHYMRQMSMNPETAGNVLLLGLESRSKTGPSVDSKMGPASLKFNL